MGMTVLEMPSLVSGYEWEPDTGCDNSEPRYCLSSGTDGGGFFIVPGSQDTLAEQALLVLDALMNPEQKPSDVAGVCKHCGHFVWHDGEMLVDDNGEYQHPEPDDENAEWVEDHELDPDADPATGLRRCKNHCGEWVCYDGAGTWLDSTDGDGCDPGPEWTEWLRRYGYPVPDRHDADVPDLPDPAWTPDLPVVRVPADEGGYDTYWLSTREHDVMAASRIVEYAILAALEEAAPDLLAAVQAKVRPFGIFQLDAVSTQVTL